MPTGTQQTIAGIVCDVCRAVVEKTSNIHDAMCLKCEENLIARCGSCGDSYINESETDSACVRRANAIGIQSENFYTAADTGEYVCGGCVYWCGNCNEAYHYEDGMLDCCESENQNIHNYGYRPYFMYYRVDDSSELRVSSRAEPGVLYMGAEIEICKIDDMVTDFLERCEPEGRDFVYFKEDASISPEGAELVTMPATLEGFEKVFPFEQLDWARKYGARSFYYSSCGFHIHVSRSAFTPSHMWKFVRFQLNNPYLCQRVAQRDESSYASWHFDDSEKQSLPEYVKGTKSNGRRYLAINFQNHDTVELRYFKGNILRSAIMKNMEFVQSIYDYTKTMTIAQVMSGQLSNEYQYHLWLSKQDKYPNLVNFLNNNSNEGDI
jgi:hypothetical protein